MKIISSTLTTAAADSLILDDYLKSISFMNNDPDEYYSAKNFKFDLVHFLTLDVKKLDTKYTRVTPYSSKSRPSLRVYFVLSPFQSNDIVVEVGLSNLQANIQNLMKQTKPQLQINVCHNKKSLAGFISDVPTLTNKFPLMESVTNIFNDQINGDKKISKIIDELSTQ